jgi:6-phosphogluconolactonase (cycloisomerase 2 family)
MKRMKLTFVLIATSLLSIHQVQAKLSQPDYVLYGTATWFGGPLANESEITLYLNNQLLTVSSYKMGSDDNLGGLYALRVPMDSNDPRTYGSARPGDPASVYINGNLVAEVLVGDYGVAERLDIDPLNLAGDTSIISALPAEVSEGNSGETTLTMDIELSNPADGDVSVDWQTIDGTAISNGSCSFDVDYIHAEGTAVITSGNSGTTISVQVCGDTVIENSETFDVVLSNAQNGVIQFDRATATILDDDGLPELRGYDAVIYEPSSGSLDHEFTLRLSRMFDQPVSVNYETVAVSASAGIDYVSVSGTLVIPANTLTGSINVTYLSDSIDEDIEIMKVVLSGASNATLVSNELVAFILDANQEEQTEPGDNIDNNVVPGLISPSDVLFSPDGSQLYVSSLHDGGSVLRFDFDKGNMNHIETIDNQVSGFESGLFGLIRDLTLSHDGRFLFAAASGDQAIMSFNRNTTNGNLTFIQTVENNVNGDFGIEGVYSLALSPDGQFIYAAGSVSDSIAVFAVNEVDGTITFVEKEQNNVGDPDDGGTPVGFMDRPIDIHVSADGTQVFVAADFSSAMVVFDRDETTGELSYQESFKKGVNGVSGLGGASALWSSDDGAHVYVLGRGDDSLSVFDRTIDGVITYNQTLTQLQADFIGLNAPTALVSSPDNSRVYGLGFDDSSLVTFKRTNDDQSVDYGELTFADIEQDDVNDVEYLAGPIALDVSPDGKWVVVAAAIDNAISAFKTHLNDLIFANGFD